MVDGLSPADRPHFGTVDWRDVDDADADERVCGALRAVDQVGVPEPEVVPGERLGGLLSSYYREAA